MKLREIINIKYMAAIENRDLRMHGEEVEASVRNVLENVETAKKSLLKIP